MKHRLSMRRTVIGGTKLKDDYCRIREGYRIGRIRLATERATALTPAGTERSPSRCRCQPGRVGSAASLESAKIAFREAWTQFYDTLTPDDIAHWHDTISARDTVLATVLFLDSLRLSAGSKLLVATPRKPRLARAQLATPRLHLCCSDATQRGKGLA